MIPGSQAISWGGLYFGKWVVDARDRFGPRVLRAPAAAPKRGQARQTGNVPRATTYTLVFAGRSWADDAKQVLGAFLGTPRNDFVHHLWGKMRAVVKPIDAQWDLVNKGTHYQVSVTIEEDTLTNNATFDRTPGTVGDDISTATGSDRHSGCVLRVRHLCKVHGRDSCFSSCERRP